ncbi:MAG: YdcF family protein [Beijerinckiaceae bacterium]|nr:YdcF family protein [Beijerinckiaceae bacterium]MDO9443335.1 YdcF family protein [Beijerinckiaceae bacterium]
MTDVAAGKPAPRSAIRRHPLLILSRLFFGAAAAGLALGFVVFVTEVKTEEQPPDRRAEGMIALTGGAERIPDAVDLFARGHANRLLITGVNQSITRAELSKLTPKFRDLVECCVDLGYDALNTTGNAQEARRWVQERGIGKTLIVVTSNYHMPRALIEMAHALPDHELIPYSVVTVRMREDRWWRNPQVARIMATEYVKYLVALARLRMSDVTGAPTVQARPSARPGPRWS